MAPMLAVAGDLPADDADWAFEFKWDGIRALAHADRDRLRLVSRGGRDLTVAFPELAGLATAVPDAVFDGELVAFDADGRPRFARVLERMAVTDARRAARLAGTVPARYLIFDLLRYDGMDTRALPYRDRRRLLAELDPAGPGWSVVPVLDDGETAWRTAIANGLEGVMAKRRAAPYRSGRRSPDWRKIKRVHTVDAVVGGWRPGARALGALLVGERTGAGLSYRGRVGGGIGSTVEKDLIDRLQPLITDHSPFVEPLTRQDSRGVVWVRPELVVEIAFGELTTDGRYRFPRLIRIRPDKS